MGQGTGDGRGAGTASCSRQLARNTRPPCRRGRKAVNDLIGGGGIRPIDQIVDLHLRAYRHIGQLRVQIVIVIGIVQQFVANAR